MQEISKLKELLDNVIVLGNVAGRQDSLSDMFLAMSETMEGEVDESGLLHIVTEESLIHLETFGFTLNDELYTPELIAVVKTLVELLYTSKPYRVTGDETVVELLLKAGEYAADISLVLSAINKVELNDNLLELIPIYTEDEECDESEYIVVYKSDDVNRIKTKVCLLRQHAISTNITRANMVVPLLNLTEVLHIMVNSKEFTPQSMGGILFVLEFENKANILKSVTDYDISGWVTKIERVGDGKE